MAQTIKVKRSAVAGKAPTTSDLELGELGLNTYDGKLYAKKDDGTESIVELSGVSDSAVTNAKVASNAAISGTKINPDFGSQNVTTTGSSTAAALIPSGSSAPTNGLYLPSANNVAISANSSERIRIGANGEIGLSGANYGTSGQVLTSAGSGAAPTWSTVAAGGASVTTSDSAPVSPSDGDLWYDSVGGRLYVYYDDGNTSQWVDAAPQGGGGGGASVTVSETAPTSPTAGDLWFDNTTTDARLYIYYDDGNTQQWIDAAPAGAGGGGATDKIEEGNTSAEVIDTGSDGRFVVTTEGTQALAVNAAQDVCIGSHTSSNFSTTNRRVLDVRGSSETHLVLSRATGTAGDAAYLQLTSTYLRLANQQASGDLRFATADTERMRIHSNGRVGLGHAPYAVGHTLDVRNNETSLSALGVYQANASFAQSSVFIDVNRATTNSSYNFLRCIQSGATDKLFIRDSGTVQNATGTYNTISDIKLKENIVDAPSQWDDIKNIRIRNYNFKPETNQQTHKQIGVVAQELELVCPGLVDEAPDRDAEGNDLGTTTKGVKSSILYMKAVKALQEAMDRIETLEAANADLAARLTALEAN